MQTTIAITTIRDDGTPFGATLTVGETAQAHVLRKFNPTDNPTVDATKVLCAAIIQQMLNLRDDPTATDPQKRAASIAITQCEALQMQAVKANFVQA